MKKITIAAVLLLVGALQMMAQAAKDSKTAPRSQGAEASATAKADTGATCAGKTGKTCTDAELKALGMASGKRRHQPITLTLGKGGALMCDRTPCSSDQLKDVSAEAGPLGLSISLNSSRSNVL